MNPKIINFWPSKDSGNFLGFCSLQIHISLNGELIPIVVKAKAMRNSNTGHVFITLHQEAYNKQDGSRAYSNLIRLPEGKFNEFNKSTEKAWVEFIATQEQANSNSSPTKTRDDVEVLAASYPHGMGRSTQTATFSTNQTQMLSQPKTYKQEEIPF